MDNMDPITALSSDPVAVSTTKAINGGTTTTPTPMETNDISFKFYSFLPCQQPKKTWNSSPKTSGYCTDTSGALVINDSDDDGSSTISADSEPQFEFLCEIDVDKNVALPRPFELKVECKQELENIIDSPQQASHEKSPQHSRHTATAGMADLSDCEDELLSLCKIEPVCDINEVADHPPRSTSSEQENNHYIYFTCPQCGERYDSHPQWRRHIVSVHQLGDQKNWNFKRCKNNEFECLTCHKIFTRCTLKTLQQHHFTHLPNKVFHCKLCPYEEHSMFLMISHIMLHKERDAAINGSDGNERANNTPTAREIALWEHESKVLIAYICPACGLTFDAEDAWQAHINFSHNFLEKTAENRFGDHFKCSECGVEIFSQHIADLQQHLYTHLPYKSYLKCKICSFNISRRNFMLQHILNIHKNHLSAGAIKKYDSILTATAANQTTARATPAAPTHATSTTATVAAAAAAMPATPTPTTTTTTSRLAGVSPAPVTTTTRSPRDERLNSIRVRSLDMLTEESVEESENSNSLYQRINITRNNYIPERQTVGRRRPSSPMYNPPPSLSQRKGSFTCERCGKHYLYSKSYSKHVRSCTYVPYNNNTTI